MIDGKLVRAANEGMGQGAYVDGPRQSFSGGAGLLSTASDYGRFLQMLLNGGELEGSRVLGPKTVELMISNHAGTLYNEGRTGFGLGFEVIEHLGRAGVPGSVGLFSWGGAYHTNFWGDPAEKIAAVLMTQLLPAGGSDLHGKFRALVYQAIVTPATSLFVNHRGTKTQRHTETELTTTDEPQRRGSSERCQKHCLCVFVSSCLCG